jgi:eukaryotic-like serine/threonine-protein kinase
MSAFGRYTLVKKLAVGGMAEVFLARADGPMGFQKRCVVKRILPHFSDDPSFVQMFLTEARLAAELNHPNLVQVFDFGQVDGQYFIAMEYIEGPNLRNLNREYRARRGPMPLPLAARLITLAAEGLHFAHELKDENGQPTNLVHRDISPDNILVSRTGSVKVVDFGIAKATNQPHLTKSGMVKGKLAYMPPEQLAREPLDRRADLFSLGVVLFELVTGEMPFDATSEVSIIQAILGQEPLRRLRSRRTDAPPLLDEAIARCLEKAPAMRYASCRELQQDLDRFIQKGGTLVSAVDIAAVVQEAFGQEFENTAPSSVPAEASLDPTVSRPVSKADNRAPPAPGGPTEAVTEPTPQPRRPPVRLKTPATGEAPPQTQVQKKLPLVPILAGLGVLVAAVAFLALRAPPAPAPAPATAPVAANPGPAAPPTPAPAPQVPVVVAEDPAAPDAGPVGASAGDPLADGAAAAGGRVAAVARLGRLELRVRPYATVSIDGQELGDTPLPVQQLPVGHHRVRLVNQELDKDVVVDFVVHPGDNVLKHNFKE